MRTYNTYDLYGLLQGLLDTLGKHANAIPLQARVELAKVFIGALPEDPGDVYFEVTPRVTQHERYKQQAALQEQTTPTTTPTLSPFGALIAH